MELESTNTIPLETHSTFPSLWWLNSLINAIFGEQYTQDTTFALLNVNTLTKCAPLAVLKVFVGELSTTMTVLLCM